jgi:hypothetical protein
MAAVCFIMFHNDRALCRERVFRDRNDPLETMQDVDLIARYRFPRRVILDLTNAVPYFFSVINHDQEFHCWHSCLFRTSCFTIWHNLNLFRPRKGFRRRPVQESHRPQQEFIWDLLFYVRIDPPHPLVCRKRPLNGAVLRMRPEKPKSRVTAGVAR